MDDIKNKLIEQIRSLRPLIQTNDFYEIHKGCTDLIRLTNMLDMKEEVFISEILESIFGNIYTTVQQSNIQEYELQKIKGELTKLLDETLNAYTNKNTQALYMALRDMRFIATQFQLKIRQKNKRNYFQPETTK